MDNNLKVIENELVPVYETDTGEKVVYGSELHRVLEVKSNYREWSKRRFTECDCKEDEDYTTVEISTVSGGLPKKENIIKLDTAKEMAMLERNEKGKQVRRYFIEIEKKYKTESLNVNKLSANLQMFDALFKSIAATELKQQEHETQLRLLDNKVESIKEVVALNPNDWRTESSRLINKIAIAAGGTEHIKDIRSDIYKLLDKRMGVSLDRRLTNMRRRIADEGACKSKRDKINKVDIIAEDKKLIEGYIAIVKEMAVKYGIDVSDDIKAVM